MNRQMLFTGLSKPIPERIREARRARGLTIADLANKVGVSRQAISQYELGQSGISGTVMAKIADVLDFPLSFYFKPVQHSSAAPSAIFFRSLKSATKNAREMFEVRTDWIEEIFRYLNNFVEFPEIDILGLSSFVPMNHDSLSLDTIDEIALHVRKEWGLGLGPINDMILTAEKHGFVVVKNSLVREKIDACSQWKSRRAFIYLGSTDTSAARIRFDVAHEMGHLILHSHLEPKDLLIKSVMDRIEKEANRFASAFLLPRDSFPQEIMSTSIDHFTQLKMRWKVSIAAMLYRCDDLGLLSESQVLYLRKQLSRYGRKSEPLDDVITFEQPRLFRQAIELLLDSGIITTHDIIHSLSLPTEEIESLAGLRPETLFKKGKVIPIRIKKD